MAGGGRRRQDRPRVPGRPHLQRRRLAAIAKAGQGFVYAQARLGVTGLRASLAAGIEDLVGRIRAHTDLPVCAGIGGLQRRAGRRRRPPRRRRLVGTALVARLADAGLAGPSAPSPPTSPPLSAAPP